MLTTKTEMLAHLDSLGLVTKTTDHPALFTVADSHEWHEKIPGAHAKNLFVKDKKSQIFLICALADSPLDLKRAHTAIGASGRLSFGTSEAMFALLGVKPGSVTPFGIVNDTEHKITVILEAALMAHDKVNFHPLENTATTTIASADLIAFLKSTGHEPKIVELPLADAEMQDG